MPEKEQAQSTWKNPSVIIKILGMFLATVVVIVAIIQQRIINNYDVSVSINGRGIVEYVPDTTIVTLGVKVERKDKAEEALSEMNDKMNKVIKSVEANGISKNDITTQDYSLAPEYGYDEKGAQYTSGYTAKQFIKIKIKNVEEGSDVVSRVIDSASKAGSNEINSVMFEASNIENLKQQARLKAIEDALTKSSEMSKALGTKFGKITGFWENVVKSPDLSYQYGYYEESKSGMSPQTPSGTQEIIMDVSVNFKIK